ncbi:hypothetical protein FSP39_006602 [Pinctada imbricata]|uniref:Uncharacterized protein n=1 Tax=Pinctada imbricata TaxID=66713 RepID=A0AA88XQ80_PINIB|nr:hypothetical protein FSP39_006602 [Pinctada imbricata]
MANINRVGSPMDLCEENYNQTKDQQDEKRRFLENKQRSKSPFFIGSIEEVNRKISKLDHKLQRYTELVVESRASHYEDIDDSASVASAKGRDRFEKREKETKELNKFAGYFTMKQAFLPGRSERVKNISKVSMQPSKTVVKKETGKPKFVELHQYPGYDPREITPLPDDVPVKDMLQMAAQACLQLHKKPQYKPFFERWFYSEMSEAVYLDLFWYLFLDKYQSSKNSQVRLFNRAAHNYVKLMLYVQDPVYRDVFFKDYPTLISQALYAGYCHSFPDSYKQFGEQFKEELVILVYGWIAGIRPSPRCWLLWNMDKLEPANIKTREEMMNREKSKKSSPSLNFDFLDSLFSSNASQYTSTTSLNQSFSKTSVQSYGKRYRKKGLTRKGSSHSSVSISSKLQAASPGSSQEGTLIDSVADYQKTSRRQSNAASSQTSRRTSVAHPGGGATKQRPVDARKLMDALTPIRETTLEEDQLHAEMKRSEGNKTSTVSVALTKAPTKSTDKVVRESHPACKGPNYIKSIFNMNGQSPLVAHYLRQKNLDYASGTDVLAQRTELQDLPAYPSTTNLVLIIHNE